MTAYIFSLKMWGGNWTNIYSLHNSTEQQSAYRIDSLYIPGLVTEAYYSQDQNRLFLSAHSAEEAFVIEGANLQGAHFSTGSLENYFIDIADEHSIQIEGIEIINPTSCFMSSEGNFTGSSSLYKLIVDPISSNYDLDNPNSSNIKVYLNPTSGIIKLNNCENCFVSGFDLSGHEIFQGSESDLGNYIFPMGVYSIMATNKQGISNLPRAGLFIVY